jgi:hypothetical protein
VSGRDEDDRPGQLDREKKSFSELDRIRREGRSAGEHRPRDRASQARAEAATGAYLKEIDGLFGAGKAGDREKLVHAMLDARGTPEQAAACRALLEGVGPPTDARQVSCFLDCGETELVLAGLVATRAAHSAGSLEMTAGLRTQLRMLAENPDDDIAGAAEDLLEGI